MYPFSLQASLPIESRSVESQVRDTRSLSYLKWCRAFSRDRRWCVASEDLVVSGVSRLRHPLEHPLEHPTEKGPGALHLDEKQWSSPGSFWYVIKVSASYARNGGSSRFETVLVNYPECIIVSYHAPPRVGMRRSSMFN